MRVVTVVKNSLPKSAGEKAGEKVQTPKGIEAAGCFSFLQFGLSQVCWPARRTELYYLSPDSPQISSGLSAKCAVILAHAGLDITDGEINSFLGSEK